VYVTTSGRRLRPGRLLNEGGQGRVYEVTADKNTVFKEYSRAALQNDGSLPGRLKAMVTHRPTGWRSTRTGHVVMAWPTDVVLRNNQFAGFLMPYVDTKNAVELHKISNPSDRADQEARRGPTGWRTGFTWQHLIRTAANLAIATNIAHRSNVVIGDFNERNIVVSVDSRVTLLDCDSMQFTNPSTGERYFCRVGRPEFTAPELINAPWHRTFRHPSSDLFALAVHIHQLLLEGEHPFRGRWKDGREKPSVSALARDGIWANGKQGLSPRRSAVGVRLLDPDTVALFQTAFTEGAVNPDRRPGAEHWHRHLVGLEKKLVECAAKPVSHRFLSHHAACPWCGARPRTARRRSTKRRRSSARTAGPVQPSGPPPPTPAAATSAAPPRLQAPAFSTGPAADSTPQHPTSDSDLSVALRCAFRALLCLATTWLALPLLLSAAGWVDQRDGFVFDLLAVCISSVIAYGALWIPIAAGWYGGKALWATSGHPLVQVSAWVIGLAAAVATATVYVKSVLDWLQATPVA
jgi:DNA-binding helix-hairpin-helix protein with protein kinase domain